MSQSLSLARQQFLFDISSRYMMTTSHRQRIDKLIFLLLLTIEVVLYEFLIFLSFTYLLKLNLYIPITPVAFSVHYHSNTLPQLYTRSSSQLIFRHLHNKIYFTFFTIELHLQMKYIDILLHCINRLLYLLFIRQKNQSIAILTRRSS